MTTEFTPFFMSTYPFEVLQERQRILANLVRYVTGSWEDIYTGKRDPRAGEFARVVDAAIFRHFAEWQEIPKRLQPKMRQPGDTFELVAKAFEEASSGYGAQKLAVPHLGDEKLMMGLAVRWDSRIISTGSEAKPSVLGAFQMACDNFLQAETRMVGLWVIMSMIRVSDYHDPTPLPHYDALRNHIYERKMIFMRDMLVFGGLLGGDANAHAVKTVAQEMCHKIDGDGIQYSVMHFIQSDGRHPGRYMSKTAEDLSKDIKAKFDAL